MVSTLLVCVLGAAVALFPLVATAQTAQPWSTVQPTSAHATAIEAARTAITDYMTMRGVPGLSVSVSINGVRAWSEGFGFADVEQRVPVTPSTRFRSGSTAKPMSMAAAAVLHDHGKLDFDTRVQALVPNFPE